MVVDLKKNVENKNFCEKIKKKMFPLKMIIIGKGFFISNLNSYKEYKFINLYCIVL